MNQQEILDYAMEIVNDPDQLRMAASATARRGNRRSR